MYARAGARLLVESKAPRAQERCDAAHRERVRTHGAGAHGVARKTPRVEIARPWCDVHGRCMGPAAAFWKRYSGAVNRLNGRRGRRSAVLHGNGRSERDLPFG